MTQQKINIRVPVLARVEGEGALELDIENEKITHLKLNIFEPPRLFEKLLEGRHYSEVPDIVARICGICPVAYQMSAVHAFESLFETKVSPWVNEMRRLFYCGEWIESHALHIHLLAAPDFLGYESAPAMAKKYPKEVKRGVEIQNLGNQIVRLLGGRSVHPVGVKVGGFYHAPKNEDVALLLEKLEKKLPEVEEMLRWCSTLTLPDIEQEFVSVSLRDEKMYPMNTGNVVSSEGLNLPIEQYQTVFKEHHEPHSTALFSLMNGEPYLLGPLARLNLNFDRLPDDIKTIINECDISFPSKNMYHSMFARAVEIFYAFRESIRVLKAYAIPNEPYAELDVKAGVAYGCTEAPRGVLWHRYEVDEEGLIKSATITPPTSQNQARMEEDLRNTITLSGLDRNKDEIRFQAEQLIRNYDPCISCATHFLDLRINRK